MNDTRFRRFVDELEPASRAELLLVLTSADAVRADIIRQFHERPGGQDSRQHLCGPVVQRQQPRVGGAAKVTVESSTTISFSAPFETAGPAVLYLKEVGR